MLVRVHLLRRLRRAPRPGLPHLRGRAHAATDPGRRGPGPPPRVDHAGSCPRSRARVAGYAGRTRSAARAGERLTRKPDRGHLERDELDALLDEVLAGTLSTVVDGRPWVVPMLYARDGDRILLHGSTGAGALRHVAAGAPAALSVTVVDGLVVAHSTFDSSANYRSAVVHGELHAAQRRGPHPALDPHLRAAHPRGGTPRCGR